MKKLHNSNFEKVISIGALAKKMGVTVRTLQFYDRQGLLVPSEITPGKRRYYTKKDLIKLHQILSLKYLGFSLSDIKNCLTTFHSPQDVIQTLELQRQMLKEQSTKIEQVLSDTETLLKEVKQMNTVGFDRFANIIVLLRQKNDSYWLFKLFSDKLFHHINERFYEEPDAWIGLYKRWKCACDETLRLKELEEPPESPCAQNLAKEWWNMMMEFLGGDLTLLSELRKFESNFDGWNEEMKKKIPLLKGYRNKLLKVYLKHTAEHYN